MPSNSAAYLTGPKAHPLQIRSSSYTSPRANEITVRNHAIAMNPLDGIKQSTGNIMFTWLKYPIIMGSDVAGEVVEVGPGVTRFAVGDRIIGHALGMSELRNSNAEGGFQHFTVLQVHMASRIPANISYESACVVPLGLSTAACALFQDDQLALPLPSVSPVSTGKTILVWGGSSSVGANAIQLAIAAERSYPDILRAFEGRKIGGALSIGHGAADACLDILGKLNGTKTLAMISYPGPKTPPQRLVALTTAFTFVYGMLSLMIKSRIKGIKAKFVFGDTLQANGVGEAVYQKFLDGALENGSFVPTPKAQVVGHGLDKVQEAVDLLMKGMSATKVVVTL